MFIELPIRYAIPQSEADKRLNDLGIELPKERTESFTTDIGCVNVDYIIRFNRSEDDPEISVLWINDGAEASSMYIEMDYDVLRDKMLKK